MIKTKLTPIRYPGGKSNALKFLNEYLPKNFTEYREPFFGGGSVGLYLMQINKESTYWINDYFYPVYCFWKTIYEHPYEMVNWLINKKKEYIVDDEKVVKGIRSKNAENGKKLHAWCRSEIILSMQSKDDFRTACLWYILNKTSYSGMSMIGSYAPLAWDQNFTDNCIQNLPHTTELMRSVKDVHITNLDYSELLKPNEELDINTFIFLDPPYKIPHSLYGNEGNMHEGFDHLRFTNEVKGCLAGRWLVTYNEDKDIQEWFKDYHQLTWELRYTMKAAIRTSRGNLVSSQEKKIKKKIEKFQRPKNENSNSEKCGKRGKELLIANYSLEQSLTSIIELSEDIKQLQKEMLSSEIE